jgi:hypothetical protein
MCFPFCAHCRASCCHNFLFSRALFSSPNAYRPTSRSGHCIVFPLSTLWPKYIKITARTADEVVFYIKQHSSLSSAGYIYIYRTQKALQEMSFDIIFGCGCLLFLLLPIIFHIRKKKKKKNRLKALKSKRLEINLLPRHWSHMLLLSTGLFRWQIFFSRAPHLYNLIDLLCICTYSYTWWCWIFI